MQFLNIFHVLVAIALVAFVLIQKGQGATAGAAFGAGASGTVFGARGAGNFLSKTTWILATLFCTISLTMAVIVSRTVEVPQDDLGVLGGAPTAPASDSSVIDGEVSVSSDQTTNTDVPVFEAPADLSAEQQQMIENAADDLPAVNSVEIDEAPTVTDGQPDEQPEPDGN